MYMGGEANIPTGLLPLRYPGLTFVLRSRTF